MTAPMVIQERPPNSKPAISKRTVRQSEAMLTPTIDLPVTNKEGVDALNTLILRKLAKESFMNGVPRKSGHPGEFHCDRKVGTRETLREARSTSISCKCGSNGDRELLSSFPNPHDNAMCGDFSKNNLAPFDSAKIPDGVGSLLSRVGLDNRKRSDQDLLQFQNSSRFNKAPQDRTLGSTQSFQKFIRSQDSGEGQSASTHSSPKEFLSILAAQASNSKSSMHAVGQTWCIREVNSSGNFIGPEFSPFRRCSADNYEEATALKSKLTCPLSTTDELASSDSNLLRPHVNSPVHTQHAPEEVTTQSSLRNALTKGIQIRFDETADPHTSRCEPRIDSTLSGRDLIRKIFREEGEVEAALLKRAPWSDQLRTAEHVHWNLRELMQREEVEEDVDASLNSLRNEHTVGQGVVENDCQLDELARNLVRNQPGIKQENCSEGCGTPRRVELCTAALKNEESQSDGLILEDRKTESNITSKSQLIEEQSIQRVLVQKERTEGRASMRQNHGFSSCTGDICRNIDSKEEDKHCQGKDPSPDLSKLVASSDSYDDSAAIRELEVDCETGRDDLEVLLKFLTVKQQLRESRRNDFEVVKTEAILRDLISRMKLDSDCSSSVDSVAPLRFLQWYHSGEPVVDDGFVGGKESKEALTPFDISNAVVYDMSPGLTSESNADSQVIYVHKNQKVNHLCTPEVHQLPLEVPTASKSQSLQLMIGLKSTQRTRSCSRNFYNAQPEEYVGMLTDPSEKSEETRRRSGLSRVGTRRAECCISNATLPTQRHAIELGSDEIVRVGSHCYVVKGESSSVTRMESMDERNGGTIGFEIAECNGTSLFKETPCAFMSSQLKNAFESPAADATPLRPSRNLESRSFASNAPAIPWKHQREKLLAVGRNVQHGSPQRRSTVISPANSPQHHRQCRDSPRTKSSANSKPSPMASPRRQQRPRPAMAALNFSAAQLDAQTSFQTVSKDPITNSSQDVDSFPSGISDMVVQESIALAKDSSDPYADFRDSMLEMMQEKNLWQRQDELQDLLLCFLHLNQPIHHHLIHQAFSDVVSYGSPLNYLDLNRKTKLSKDILTKKSSPSNQRHEVT